ncbi:MAG: TonB-dependent receptor [Vicinamibacterales bacterium]
MDLDADESIRHRRLGGPQLVSPRACPTRTRRPPSTSRPSSGAAPRSTPSARAPTRRRQAVGVNAGSTTPATPTSRKRLWADLTSSRSAAHSREWYPSHRRLRSDGRGGAGHDYRLFFSSGTPIEVLLYNSPFTSENNVNYQGGYIRDVWRVGDRLTLNLGLRFERYDVFLPAQTKPAGPFSDQVDYARRNLYDWRGIVPRIGMSWAVTPDNRTVVKATWGRFNHAIRPSSTEIVRNLNGNEYEATRYRWNDLNGDRDLDYPGELGQFILIEGGSGSRGIHNPDLRQPKSEETSVRLERQLGEVRVRQVRLHLQEGLQPLQPRKHGETVRGLHHPHHDHRPRPRRSCRYCG